ncbi:hypothetical protein K4L06_08115 [Lysobacter sp. BMK333-48F3]|uniref:hypothetical protein n=1 Tax=Lysobacter sp. BMK333-48F3 TaxID=2867962 RepID=UPI001C8B5CA9|nr:hypothetical protein [Lysobacter sp. BMK333-48F3]MBX9401277.1 hypothetical protein [Lysobacter sp. BMK333-48F3]
MDRMLVPLACACLLAGCARVDSKAVDMDIGRLYPGCRLQELASTQTLRGSDEQLLARFTYTCAGDSHLKYGHLVYTKAMSTGFYSYCCAREATAEEL